MRFFNTAGPVRPDEHYCIPPLERFDLDEVLRLVETKKYFVLHAPRQTGKTSALLALADLLNGQGYGCVYTTVETARTAREDVEQAMRTVLAGLSSQVRSTLGDESTVAEGVEQTAGHMDRSAAEAGHLVVIDQREGRSWEEKVFHCRRRSEGGVPVEVWGM